MKTESFRFFKNMLDVIETYPIEQQLAVAKAIIRYGLFEEEPESIDYRAIVQALKPSLDKKDNRGGKREGAGRKEKPKNDSPVSNQTPPEESIDDILQALPEWIVDILVGKSPPPDECDLDVETQKIYRKINPHINSYLSNQTSDKRQLLFNIRGALDGYKVPPPPPPPYVKTGKKFKLEFCKTIEEIDLCKEWLQYKKSQGKPFRDEGSVELFMERLRELGGGNIEKMRAIVKNSRSNNYDGLVPPKVNGNLDQKTNTEKSHEAYASAIETIKKREAKNEN